jgi:cytochrome P450
VNLSGHSTRLGRVTGDPLNDPRFLADPYPFYDRLRAAAPVVPLPAGSEGRRSFVVTGYDAARAALADPRLSKDTARFFAGRPARRDLHPAVAHSMLAQDPPDHTRLRAALTKSFTPKAVGRLRPSVERLVEEILAAWSPGEAVDLVTALAAPLPVTVICELLGVPEEDRDRLRGWSGDLFAAGEPDRIDAASHAVAGYMAGLVAAKRRRPDGSLLHHLVSDAEDRHGEDRIGEDELVSLAVLLLVAGHETTTNFLGNAVLALLRDADARERLRRDPGAWGAALDELLRLDSPVAVATFRWSTEPLTLDGVDVPAGVPVLVSPGAANRDPARFAAPGRLDLDRDARGHLAFGHGVHRCLGAPLARMEAEIALRALFTRFPGLRLDAPPEELRWRRTRLMRGLVALPVVL